MAEGLPAETTHESTLISSKAGFVMIDGFAHSSGILQPCRSDPRFPPPFSTPLAAGTYNADPQAYQRLQMQALPPVEGATVLGTGLLQANP